MVQIYYKLTSTSFKEVTTSPVEKPTLAREAHFFENLNDEDYKIAF